MKNRIFTLVWIVTKLWASSELCAATEEGIATKEAEGRSSVREEALFLEAEKNRFNDLSLKIVTESGREILLPDFSTDLAKILSEFRDKEMHIVQEKTCALYEHARVVGLDRRKKWDINEKLSRVSGGNLAIGQIHIILKDGTGVVRTLYSESGGGQMFFSSGTAAIFTDVLKPGVLEGETTPDKSIRTRSGNEVYFCDSGQEETTTDKQALNWFKKLLRNNRNLYRYTYEYGNSKKVDMANDKDANAHIRSLFFHSENALLLYIIRNFNNLLDSENIRHRGDRRLRMEEVQYIIIDFVTERDMCDGCFKTMWVVAGGRMSEDFRRIPVIIRAAGIRSHEVRDYSSRTSEGRSVIEKYPLDIRDVHPQIEDMQPRLYVKNLK